VVFIPYQPDPVAIPNIGDECVTFGKPLFQLRGSENSVVDLAAQEFFRASEFGGKLRVKGPSYKQQINIAGGVHISIGEGTIQPRRFNPLDAFKGVSQ
jgi:hypothetical protein